MPVLINGTRFYRTKEALERAGISRATWFRWLQRGLIEDVTNKDPKGWRLFTDEDIVRIQEFAYGRPEHTPQLELRMDMDDID